MVTSSDTASLDLVLEAFDLSRAGKPSEVPGGTLNGNYRVPSANGPVFARCYRFELDREWIEHEHAVTHWVAEHGGPAIAPLSTPDGQTVIVTDGRLWALFPWVDGRQHVRGELTSGETEAIGEAHGHIQRLLADHPESEGASLKLLSDRVAWNTEASLESLAEVVERATASDASSDLLGALTFQQRLLESEPSREFAEFDWLPCQMLHGDFHDQQILLGADETVAGVVDWEMTQPAARVWELVRSLHFSKVLETELLEHYLGGYRKHMTLTKDECRAAIEFWWQNRLHGTWAYRAYFLEGSDLVTDFFPEMDRHLRSFAEPRQRERIADRLVAALT
jgi:Ser/Thr protein kinase RdoA (MazF antagonist)